MSTAADRPKPFANPRPGVVKALGIGNIVFSILGIVLIFMSSMYLYAATRAWPTVAVTEGGPSAPANPAGLVMMGMNDPAFLRFCVVDNLTGLVLNLVMFATGIGLINLRRWGARIWAWAAWIMIVQLVVLWGFYIVAIAPSLSESMARSVLAMRNARVGTRAPSVGDLTRLYSIMNLIVAVGVIAVGSIYPAVSLWMLGRPGVKAALVDDPSKEPGLP